MRRMLAIAVVCTGAGLALAASWADASTKDRRHGPGHARYELSLRWQPKSFVLDGVERIGFENTRAGTVHSVWLRLWANGRGSCRHRLITIHLLSGGHLRR